MKATINKVQSTILEALRSAYSTKDSGFMIKLENPNQPSIKISGILMSDGNFFGIKSSDRTYVKAEPSSSFIITDEL
jgi:hypothetical protein